jgi:hypothetical protein
VIDSLGKAYEPLHDASKDFAADPQREHQSPIDPLYNTIHALISHSLFF